MNYLETEVFLGSICFKKLSIACLMLFKWELHTQIYPMYFKYKMRPIEIWNPLLLPCNFSRSYHWISISAFVIALWLLSQSLPKSTGIIAVSKPKKILIDIDGINRYLWFFQKNKIIFILLNWAPNEFYLLWAEHTFVYMLESSHFARLKSA